MDVQALNGRMDQVRNLKADKMVTFLGSKKCKLLCFYFNHIVGGDLIYIFFFEECPNNYKSCT